MTQTQLSEKVQALVKKSRIVSFATWHDSHTPEAIQYLQTADDQGRYLSDEDIRHLQILSSTPLLMVALQLRNQSAEIVDEARGQILATFPQITEPGGGLYPPRRATSCWRDLWNFLRCMTYGIAGGREDYTSREGLAAMQELYQELNVPLDAMVVGLEGIKFASLRRIPTNQREIVAPYFDHLIEQLKQFSLSGSCNTPN